MKKTGSFLLGALLGAGISFIATSLLVPDEDVEKVKDKIKNNANLTNLKKKYDNGTEIIKNQLAAFPKPVEDDSEIKDFDDIVIDDTKDDESEDETSHEDALSDLANSEPSDSEDETTPSDDEIKD